MNSFQIAPLEDLVSVRATGSDRAHLWLRSSAPGVHRIELWADGNERERTSGRFEIDADPSRDHIALIEWPADIAGAAPLQASTRYRFRVVRESDAGLVGEGRFETAPRDANSAPETFALAIVSCHEPFDAAGRVREASVRALSVLEAAFEAYQVKRVLWLGDQLYADSPRKLSLFEAEHFARVAPPGRESLFDCTRAEVRALAHDRYHAYWSIEPFKRILSRWPCMFMLDDHEIVDNYGSDPEHATEKWRSVREGALDAFDDYQATGLAPRGGGTGVSRHFDFEYGPLAVFVMDLRSQRHTDADAVHVFDVKQERALRAFLDRNRQRDVVGLGLSVPLVHIPDWVATAGTFLSGKGTDLHDRWSHPLACADRDRLVRLLVEHRTRCPEQRLLLLSGDIHAGVASRLSWEPSGRGIVQFVSSAVSNLESPLVRALAEHLPRLPKQVDVGDGEICCNVELLDGEGQNPFSGLNAGIVVLQRSGDRYTVRVQLISDDGGDPPKPRVVFRSPEL